MDWVLPIVLILACGAMGVVTVRAYRDLREMKRTVRAYQDWRNEVGPSD